MSRVVIDASLTLSWCFEDESGDEEFAILQMLGVDLDAVVPAIWPVEILNGCLIGARSGRIDTDGISRFLDELNRLPIEITAPPEFARLDVIYAMSRSYNLTAYDASYLELAMRVELPLATLDAQLKNAARKAGVPTRIG